MKVIKVSEVKVEEQASELFTGGRADRQVLVDEKIAKELRLVMVTFSPGVRTKIHTHTSDQVLYITDGKGIVATEKEEHIVMAGTVAFIPAGEPHWHGATKDTSFSQISIRTPDQTTF